jgi:hypothetical protein
MKTGFCSATPLNGSAALPFVISTGAPKERSGEICGPAALSWKCLSSTAILKEFLSRFASFLFKSDLTLAVRLYACEGLGC